MALELGRIFHRANPEQQRLKTLVNGGEITAIDRTRFIEAARDERTFGDRFHMATDEIDDAIRKDASVRLTGPTPVEVFRTK